MLISGSELTVGHTRASCAFHKLWYVGMRPNCNWLLLTNISQNTYDLTEDDRFKDV